MEFTAEHRQLDETVTRFIEKEVNPFVDAWEQAEEFPSHAVFKKLGDLGLLGLKYPVAYGGSELDFSYSMVMDIVNRAKLQRAGQPVDDAVLAKMSDGLRRRLDAESGALFGTARLWDDGIIDPRDTRRILGLCLDLAAEAARRTLWPNTFGVARM